MTGRERELQDAVNTLTIRAYRAEDERDKYRAIYNEAARELNEANAAIRGARDALATHNTAAAKPTSGLCEPMRKAVFPVSHHVQRNEGRKSCVACGEQLT